MIYISRDKTNTLTVNTKAVHRNKCSHAGL